MNTVGPAANGGGGRAGRYNKGGSLDSRYSRQVPFGPPYLACGPPPPPDPAGHYGVPEFGTYITNQVHPAHMLKGKFLKAKLF